MLRAQLFNNDFLPITISGIVDIRKVYRTMFEINNNRVKVKDRAGIKDCGSKLLARMIVFENTNVHALTDKNNIATDRHP